jgi:hypothetical protein
MTDPMSRLRKVQAVMSVTQHVVRAWRVGEWALLHRVMADGSSSPPEPRRFMPDKGSSLALDDLGFMPELGDHNVSSTARFPVMSAAENLVGAGQAHGAAFQENRTAVVSMGSLCRCAIESFAKTIWLLGETDREERRARSLGFTQSERQPQQAFMRIEEKVLAARKLDEESEQYQNFRRHRSEYDARQDLIAAQPKAARKKPPANYLDIVSWSAKWIDANPPAHAAGELPLGMELGATRFYSYGSSFVHGFKWMTDYIRDDENTLTIVADGFAAAVIMAESALCLFEAQSTNPARTAMRRANYPDWLAPTVDAWIPGYR